MKDDFSYPWLLFFAGKESTIIPIIHSYLVGISRGHYVGLDRLLDILRTLHHLPQLLEQLCCNFWTHLPACN